MAVVLWMIYMAVVLWLAIYGCCFVDDHIWLLF